MIEQHEAVLDLPEKPAAIFAQNFLDEPEHISEIITEWQDAISAAWGPEESRENLNDTQRNLLQYRKTQAEGTAPYAALFQIANDIVVQEVLPYINDDGWIDLSLFPDSYGTAAAILQDGLTEIYYQAGVELTRVLEQQDHRYSGLWQYLKEWGDRHNKSKRNIQGQEKRACMVLKDVTDADHLPMGLSRNFKDVSATLIVMHGIASQWPNRPLPDADNLTKSAQEACPAWLAIATVNKKFFGRDFFYGLPYYERFMASMQSQHRFPAWVKMWTAGLASYADIRESEKSFEGCSPNAPLLYCSPTEMSNVPWLANRKAECAGQFALRTDEANVARAEELYGRLGASIGEDGAFAVADLQTRLGVAIARQTIFVDPICREGLQRAHEYLYRKTSSPQ